MTIHRRDGTSEKVILTCRIDTAEEIEYFKNGGVLHYVLRNLAAQRPEESDHGDGVGWPLRRHGRATMPGPTTGCSAPAKR